MGSLDEALADVERGAFAVAVGRLRSLLDAYPRDHRVRLALARTLVQQGRVEDAAGVIAPLLAATDLPPADRAVALALWGIVGTVAGSSWASEATNAAIAIHSTTGDGTALAWGAKAIERYVRGDLDGAIEAAARAHAASRDGAPMLRAEADVALAMMLMHADRFDEAERVLQTGHDDRERGVARSLRHRAMGALRFHAGLWDEARALLDPRPDVAAGVELDDGEWALAAGLLAVVYVHQDRLDDARRLLGDAAGPIALGQAVMLSWPAVLLAEAEGDRDRAAQLADRLMGAVERGGSLIRFRLFGPDIVRVSLAAGATSVARAVCDHLATVARAASVPSVEAASRLCSALLGRDPQGAIAAADLYAASPRPLDRAMALEAVVELAAEPLTTRGLEGARTALDIYDRLPAPRAARRLRATLRRKGVVEMERRRRRPTAASGWAALSPAEEAVARLVADGLTNAEIAARLYVSPRTVETHVAHAFGKLGVASRAGIAAVAARSLADATGGAASGAAGTPPRRR